MTTFHHLFPYPPWGWYGGTLRLRTAIEASELVGGSALVSWWNRDRASWLEVAPAAVGQAPRDEHETVTPFATTGIKRRLFPATLWESGIKPRAGAAEAIARDEGATIVLHTTYLAPLAVRLRRSGRRAVVDAHDVVFRAHEDDARLAASPGLRAFRRLYAAGVKSRETRSLRSAAGLPVAGWDDARLLRDLGLDRAAWVPVGVEAELSTAPDDGRLAVGLIGNFAHSANAAAARELLASPLAQDNNVEIVFAGNGSEGWAASSSNVRCLGAVTSVSEFYDCVHAVVLPVTNGSGMKCKLGEAALAGKAVITTSLGAAGYAPDLRDAFLVIDSARSLDRELVEGAVEATTPRAVRERFDQVVGRKAAAATYAQILTMAPGSSF